MLGHDYVCTMHGLKMSEHTCLYCALCFCDLTQETCNRDKDGLCEDVCVTCAEAEQAEMKRRGLIS